MDMNFEQIISYFVLGLLITFLTFLGLGILYGFMRGGKRAAIRLVTVIAAMIATLICTPMVAKILINQEISGFGTVDAYFTDSFKEGGMLGSVEDTVPGIAAFAKVFALMIVNIVLFFIMYYVLKIATWIIYAIIAHIFAKNKLSKSARAAGEVAPKKYRIAGMGFGFVTGFVFFAFFSIPLFGFIQATDEIATHNATFAGYSTPTTTRANDDNNIGVMAENAHYGLVKTNKQIQTSAIGRISKYSGMQTLGKFGTKYLCEVEGIDMRGELVGVGKTTINGLAIVSTVMKNNEGEGNDLIGLVNRLNENDIKSIAGILDTVTNSKTFGALTRKNIDKYFGSSLTEINNFAVDAQVQINNFRTTEFANILAIKNDLETKLDAVLAAQSTLESDSSTLDNLFGGSGDLTELKTLLSGYYPELVAQIEALEAAKADVSGQVNAIVAQITSLKEKIATIEATINKMFADINTLVDKMSVLNAQLGMEPDAAGGKIDWEGMLLCVHSAIGFIGGINVAALGF
jgi:hypothetical protein